MSLIVLKDEAAVDGLTKNLIDGLNTLEELWDADDAISADVITDVELYEDDEVDDTDDEGVSSCTVLVEIPNADYSLMLVQDEDDEDRWFIAVCNYSDDDPRSIDSTYELDGSSTVI